MDISPRGREQAAALAEYLHGQAFQALYASPMRRVQQTLAPFFLNGMPRPIVLPELQEFDFGDWTGLSFAEVHARYGVRARDWLDQVERAAIPNAESVPMLKQRLAPCLSQILERHSSQSVLVACHGGVIRMLLSLLLDWPLSRFGAIEIDYASITQVACTDRSANVQLLNFAPWRDLVCEQSQGSRGKV